MISQTKGASLLFGQNFPEKLYENERNWIGGGGLSLVHKI